MYYIGTTIIKTAAINGFHPFKVSYCPCHEWQPFSHLGMTTSGSDKDIAILRKDKEVAFPSPPAITISHTSLPFTRLAEFWEFLRGYTKVSLSHINKWTSFSVRPELPWISLGCANSFVECIKKFKYLRPCSNGISLIGEISNTVPKVLGRMAIVYKR